MKHRISMCMAATAMAALLVVAAGCGSDQPVSSNATTVSSNVPTFAEVNAALSLDQTDAAVVKSALSDWQQNAKQPHDGLRGGFGFARQEMQFVAAVAPSLTNDQLTKLVNLLVERRDAQREEMRASHHGMPDGEHMKQMAADLGLTADQQAALKALHEDTRAKAQAQFQAFKRGDITEDQLHTQLDAIHDAAHAKLATILSADQLAKFDAMRSQRFENRMERRAGNAADRIDAHAAWIDKALTLTDAQASQVKAALTKLSDAQDATFKAVQAGSITRDQAHTQMRAAHDAFAESLKGILTTDQEQRLEILRQLIPGPIHHA